MLSGIDRAIERNVGSRPAGLVRALIGIAVLLKGAQVLPVLARFADPTVLRTPYLEWVPTVADLPVALVAAMWLGFAALFAVGLFTTVSGVGLTLTLAGVLLSDQQVYSNHLYLLTLLVGLLTLARAGSAISVDALRGESRPTIPDWPLLLIRIQVSVVYLFAGLSKINATFLSGTVVAVTLRSDGPLAIPIAWRTFELMATLSIIAVVMELFLAVALWLPRWRRTAFVIGLALHVGIAIWLIPTGQLAIFSIIILSPYLLFLPAPPRGAALVWDDACDFCGSWIRLARRLDWLHALRIVPSSDPEALAALEIPREDADRALQLVRDGRRHQGYRAVVGAAEVLPLSFLWAPVFRLPPIAWVGDRIYRRVALNRSCSIAGQRTVESA